MYKHRCARVHMQNEMKKKQAWPSPHANITYTLSTGSHFDVEYTCAQREYVCQRGFNVKSLTTCSWIFSYVLLIGASSDWEETHTGTNRLQMPYAIVGLVKEYTCAWVGVSDEIGSCGQTSLLSAWGDLLCHHQHLLHVWYMHTYEYRTVAYVTK